MQQQQLHTQLIPLRCTQAQKRAGVYKPTQRLNGTEHLTGKAAQRRVRRVPISKSATAATAPTAASTYDLWGAEGTRHFYHHSVHAPRLTPSPPVCRWRWVHCSSSPWTKLPPQGAYTAQGGQVPPEPGRASRGEAPPWQQREPRGRGPPGCPWRGCGTRAKVCAEAQG